MSRFFYPAVSTGAGRMIDGTMTDDRHSQAARGSAGAGDPALSFIPRGWYQLWGKRLFDAIASVLGLLVLSPVFALVALAIKLDSEGPVCYRSTRLGRCARPFQFLKFRSMHKDAEKMRDQLDELNEMDGPVFKIQNDPRMTRVGRLLRKTSLDELPQLLHVLCGEMSLVGPRPPIPAEVEHYEPWQRRRLSVTPGITCLWQVSGRNQVSFDEWMQLDMQYIDQQSLGMDVKILALTLPAVLRRKGAS